MGGWHINEQEEEEDVGIRINYRQSHRMYSCSQKNHIKQLKGFIDPENIGGRRIIGGGQQEIRHFHLHAEFDFLVILWG